MGAKDVESVCVLGKLDSWRGGRMEREKVLIEERERLLKWVKCDLLICVCVTVSGSAQYEHTHTLK